MRINLHLSICSCCSQQVIKQYLCSSSVRTNTHGRRSRGGGRGQVPPRIWSGGIVPQILSCCKILSTKLLALQCRKMCFCLYSRTFIVSPAMHSPPPRIPVRSTTMLTLRAYPTCVICYTFCPSF